MAGKPAPPLATRLFWFVTLWLAGVAAVGAVALAIRQLL
jgi:uncharacterized protein DUF2474